MSERTLVFACPTLSGDPEQTWWSARYIVALGAPLAAVRASADYTVKGLAWAEIVYDVDPIESGLDEYRWRRAERREVIEVPIDDLLLEVQVQRDPVAVTTEDAIKHGDLEDADETTDQPLAFRTARDLHRIEHGLPRHVVRSDVYDAATKTCAPLYALRHLWPAGTFLQGGTASRQVPATSGHLADPDVHTFEMPDGTTLASLRDRVFIEAFPPPTPDHARGGFLRAQGETFAETEDALWAQWVKKQTCPAVAASGQHRWETRGYKNGAGFCADCNVFGSHVFDVAEVGDPCVVCGVRTWHAHVGVVGGEVDASGKPNRYRRSRAVCAAHAPPSDWVVTGVLGQAESGDLDTTWLTRFLPSEAAGLPLADVEHRFLSDALADGRAWLVDETIAGRRDPETLGALAETWAAAASQGRV